MKLLQRIGLLLLCCGLWGSAWANSNQPVVFEKGKFATMLSGEVKSNDRISYVLRAQTGQVMTVAIAGLKNDATFSIQYQSASGEWETLVSEGQMLWQGLLPSSKSGRFGDYHILVGGLIDGEELVQYQLFVALSHVQSHSPAASANTATVCYMSKGVEGRSVIELSQSQQGISGYTVRESAAGVEEVGAFKGEPLDGQEFRVVETMVGPGDLVTEFEVLLRLQGNKLAIGQGARIERQGQQRYENANNLTWIYSYGETGCDTVRDVLKYAYAAETYVTKQHP